MSINFFSFLLFFAISISLNLQADEISVLPEILVQSKSKSEGLKTDEVSSVQRLSKTKLEAKKAQTFSEVIDDEKGIDTQTACAFCGTKRVTINGLKGEHTTLLIDGMALHSTVSGFYGLDAIPLQGIESVDIYRGAGAALAIPEALGGAISITTADPFMPLKDLNTVVSDDGQLSLSTVHTFRLSQKTALLLGAQISDSKPVDNDHNKVTEQAFLKTKSFLSKLNHKMNEVDELSFRFSAGYVDTVGGNPEYKKLKQPANLLADSADFTDSDVRKKYIGDPNKITDNINIERYELSGQYFHQLNSDSSLKLSLGQAWQIQDSIYSHGYDYKNTDHLSVIMLESTMALNNEHILSIGLDHKNQWMRSNSNELYNDQGLSKDNLQLQTYGAYLQDTWIKDDFNEFSLVLRADHIQTRWSEFNKSINQTVLAPRIHYKHIHNSVFTSRIGWGVGYRAPLTLFESQHGTIHDGFLIEIDQVETSNSFVYSLAGQRLEDFFEFSMHHTFIDNMAYGLDQAITSQPLLFKNASSQYLVSTYDLSYGKQFSPLWNFETLAEIFVYPNGYKEKLPVAANEKRLSFISNLQLGQWHLKQKINVINEVDLSQYGYDKHYNIAYTDTEVTSPTFNEIVYADQKKQKSPTYATLDLDFETQLSKLWNFGFSIKNVFDYTQTGVGDSPLTWAQHGSHYHLDNFHIWGPLRGRQLILSLKGELL